jgi:uncharacterized protein (DUF983 family)
MSDFKSLLRSLFLLKCPHCGTGPLFGGIYTLRATCPNCNARYEREPGEWTGAVVIVYVFSVFTSYGLWLWMFATDRLFDHAEWAILALALALIAGTYRNAKALWIWFIHLSGHVYPDSEHPL